MSLNILLIEDNPHKLQRVLDFLKQRTESLQITEARSFSSGSQALTNITFDLVIADISLPTYDKSPTESGGRFRALGGREIARKISRAGKGERVVFITQYESFGDKGLSYTFHELSDMLSSDLGAQFLGMIYYDSSMSTWKEQLNSIILQEENENSNR
ncbi:hypothetical protein [Acidovorax sp. LjRoot117]|uniref:hypothetical protein n=1 Tax=Acidovorax sp. LjRoot117 TaxID=3342255 RepID=UPI003ECC57BB